MRPGVRPQGDRAPGRWGVPALGAVTHIIHRGLDSAAGRLAAVFTTVEGSRGPGAVLEKVSDVSLLRSNPVTCAVGAACLLCQHVPHRFAPRSAVLDAGSVWGLCFPREAPGEGSRGGWGDLLGPTLYSERAQQSQQGRKEKTRADSAFGSLSRSGVSALRAVLW